MKMAAQRKDPLGGVGGVGGGEGGRIVPLWGWRVQRIGG